MGYTSREEIEKRQGGNGISPRRNEIKLRKNEMKVRKKGIEVPMNFSFPRWRIFVFHRGFFDFLEGGRLEIRN